MEHTFKIKMKTFVSRVSIGIFDVFDHIWNLGDFLLMDPILIWARIVTSRTETLNCDISSLENDIGMVDQ